ncbi:3291_t:CDS:2, partial [Racocetra persica]
DVKLESDINGFFRERMEQGYILTDGEKLRKPNFDYQIINSYNPVAEEKIEIETPGEDKQVAQGDSDPNNQVTKGGAFDTFLEFESQEAFNQFRQNLQDGGNRTIIRMKLNNNSPETTETLRGMDKRTETRIGETKKTTSQEIDQAELETQENENEIIEEQELDLNEIEQEKPEQGIGERSQEKEHENEQEDLIEKEKEKEQETEPERETERETEQEREQEREKEREAERERQEQERLEREKQEQENQERENENEEEIEGCKACDAPEALKETKKELAKCEDWEIKKKAELEAYLKEVENTLKTQEKCPPVTLHSYNPIAENAWGSIHFSTTCSSFKEVVLKSLNNSQEMIADFLQEIASYKLLSNIVEQKSKASEGLENYQQIVQCHGISQDPATGNYFMVMDYIPNGGFNQSTSYPVYQIHPSAIYTSSLLDTERLRSLLRTRYSQKVNNEYGGSKNVELDLNLLEFDGNDQTSTNEYTELTTNFKRQLSLESQTKTNQGETKQPKLTEILECCSEPMPINNNQSAD